MLQRVPIRTAAAEPASTTKELPTVTVARVERRDIGDSLKVAGEFKPFQDVEIHAKVAGYIRNINVDVGDRVREGQTLAVLEIPELSAQLAGADAAVRRSQEEIRRARSTVERAQSAHAAAHSAYARLKQASEAKAGLVAQQEVDDAQAKDLEAEAQVASAQAELAAANQQLEIAQANQQQFHALAGYSRIVAPFSGVVTMRYADTGALIQAGTSSSTQAMPVVRVAEVSKLRLVLPIPESVAARIRVGDAVRVVVQALNQEFEGKVSRFADAVNRETRTMETEIDFKNHEGRLMPGMYAEATLSTNARKNALTIPMESVTRNGDDATVWIVNAKNQLEERHVKLGLEGTSQVEVTSGLNENDRIAIGSRSQFHSGESVSTRELKAEPTAGAS